MASIRSNSRRKLIPLAVAALGLAVGWGAVAAESGLPPVSFQNDVVPLLTKAGCSGGACHAKAPAGQNGFRLSLLGFEPSVTRCS
jgi:hypothetical protein